jgi:hypothetical protein
MSYYDTGAFSQIVGPLEALWTSAAAFVPILVSAIVVFVIGLVVATAVGTLLEKLFDSLRVDSILKQLGVGHYVERAGLRLHASRFLGQLAFWFITIAFLVAASDILGLSVFSSFLRQVVSYLPNVVVAILVMLAAIVIANVARSSVKAAVRGGRMPGAHFLGTLTWWAIAVFGLLAALDQLGVASGIIQTIVTGFIAMVALAGGLALGLGGKDYAGHLINKLREHTEMR